MTLVGGLGGREGPTAPEGGPGRIVAPATLGALALSGSNAIRIGVQFAMLPILARLLEPAEFGLVALAVPIILFCNLLADAGMGQALARRQTVTPELESTVFFLAGGLGLGLTLLLCAAAWPLGLGLGQPGLPWLIVALSPILAMSGLTAVANARIIRAGRFGVFAAGELISTAVSATLALAAALNGAGAWSLVVQQVALWTCKFVWVNAKARPRIRPHLRPSEAVDLLRFGLNAIGANVCEFVSRNAANLIIGAALGATALGYYAIAFQIIRLPDMIISGPLYLYVFSAVARAAEDEARGAAADLAVSALRLASSVLAPVFAGLGIVAPLAVQVLLGQKWEPAGPVLTHLAVAGFGFSGCIVVTAILMGLGRSGLQFRLAVVAGLANIAAVVAFARHGIEAASLALGVSIVAVFGLYLAVLAWRLGIAPARLAGAFAPAAAGVVALTATLLAVRPAIGHMPQAAQLVLLIALGAAAYTVVVLGLSRQRIVADARAFAAAHS